ncbi:MULTISPECIES: hypothetical protein [unclassified Moorena]|nr:MULTISPECIES: hypothetical protein [unclassified Moorena]
MAYWPRDRVQPTNLQPTNLQPTNLQPANLGLLATRSRSTY